MPESKFDFVAHKVTIHRWPHDTPQWSDQRKKQVEQYSQSSEPKHVYVRGKTVHLDNFKFDSICKIGVTIPLFKRQSTVIFEGRCEEFYAHVHITTKSNDYLQIFNNLMNWRKNQFPDAFYIDK